MVETKTLENGLRVIVKRMEGLLSVTMGILVGTGGAFETDSEDGISHFIEHMQFKGTPTRTAFEISDAFDALGTIVNASTSKEMTYYYCKSMTEHAEKSFELLSDLFLNATFPEEEMAREKGVVIEEINMNEDSAEDVCVDLLARAFFGKENYGRNVLGPAENVSRFTREDIFAYKRERYCPENIVVSFAGNIGIEEAVSLTEKFFGGMEKTHFVQRPKNIQLRADRLLKQKPIEQAHFAIGFPSVSREDKMYPAMRVMNVILGGGMSSRLFKRVREELGLAYSVYSYMSNHQETGLLTVYAGVNPKKIEQAAEAVLSVLKEFKRGEISEEEFSRGKQQLLSGTVFAQEDTSSQMLLYGRQMLYQGEIYDFEKRMAELSALTRKDVLEAVERSFDFGRAAAATVGNLEKGISL